MPHCAAVGCTNSERKKCKMYFLPSGKNDQNRRNIWIARISRQNLPKYVSLCEDHFEPSQFEPLIPKKLKPDAVPSIFIHRAQPKNRKPPKKRKIVEASSLETTGEHSYCTFDEIPNDEETVISHNPVETSCEEPNMDPTTSASTTSSFEVDTLKRLNASLRIKLRKSEENKDKLQKMCNKLLGPDQVIFLERNSTKWSAVKRALQLRFSCGISGYNMLLTQGFPFPSDRTPRRKLQDIPFNTGVISEVYDMLSLKDMAPVNSRDELGVVASCTDTDSEPHTSSITDFDLSASMSDNAVSSESTTPLQPKGACNPPRKRKCEDPATNDIYEILKGAREKSEKRVVEDRHDIFGKHVANKLRSYTKKTEVLVQHHINNVLFQADLGEFESAIEIIHSEKNSNRF